MCKYITHNPINKLNATHILVFLISITYTILSPFAPYRLLPQVSCQASCDGSQGGADGLYNISNEFVLSFIHTNDVNSFQCITSDTFYSTL